MRRSTFIAGSLAAAAATLGGRQRGGRAMAAPTHFEYELSDAQWRARLTPAQYAVLREHATEPPWSSPLEREDRPGTYSCAGCDLPLFSSTTKFHSGTGWPSFWQPLPDAVATSIDTSWMETRTEVHCRRCGGHLGHVFDDGPPPTGLRYCINGVALVFHPAASAT